MRWGGLGQVRAQLGHSTDPDQIMVSVQRGVMGYDAADADPSVTCFPAGQGVGGFREIKPAGEVVREVVAQAEAVLARGVLATSRSRRAGLPRL